MKFTSHSWKTVKKTDQKKNAKFFSNSQVLRENLMILIAPERGASVYRLYQAALFRHDQRW